MMADEQQQQIVVVDGNKQALLTRAFASTRLGAFLLRWLDPLDAGLVTLAGACFFFCLLTRFLYYMLPKKWLPKQAQPKRNVRPPLVGSAQTSFDHHNVHSHGGQHMTTTATSMTSSVSSSVSSTYGVPEIPYTASMMAAAASHQVPSVTVAAPVNNGNNGNGNGNLMAGFNAMQQLAAIERTSLDWLNTAIIWMHSFEVGVFSAPALRHWFDAMNAEAANLAAQNRHHGLVVKFRELTSSQTPPIITSVSNERIVEGHDVRKSLLICVEWRDFALPTLVCRDEDLLAVPASCQNDPIANDVKMWSVTMFVRTIRAKIRITVEPMAETGEVYLIIVYASPPDMTFDVKPTANTDFPYNINLIHLSELLDLCVRTASVRICVKQSTLFDPSTGSFLLSPYLSSYLYSNYDQPVRGDNASDEGRVSTSGTPKKPPRLANKQQMLVKVISASFATGMLPSLQKQRNHMPFMDPYCVITTEPPFEKQVTSIVQNTSSPFWDEHFIVYIDDNTTTLILNLFDNLRQDGDPQIGAVRIDVDQIRSDADFFRQPVLMDILATIVEPSSEPGVDDEERAVIVGQLTLSAEMLAPGNEIRRRGSAYREAVPKEVMPPLPSSIVFPKRVAAVVEPATPPGSNTANNSQQQLMLGDSSSLLTPPLSSNLLSMSSSITMMQVSASQSPSRSQLSVNSYSLADSSRLDLSLMQPTIPENVTMLSADNNSNKQASTPPNSKFPVEQQLSTTSSRNRTIKITVPKLSTVVAESKSLMRKPTAKLKRNINSFGNWTKSKLEKAGSHLPDIQQTNNSPYSHHNRLLDGGDDFMAGTNEMTPPPTAGAADLAVNQQIQKKGDKSLRSRLMATLNRIQTPSSSRAVSVDREVLNKNRKHSASTLGISSDVAGSRGSSGDRPRSPRFFTERLSKTAKSLSSSLRRLIVDIQSPLISCGGGRSPRANKHKSWRSLRHPDANSPTMMSGGDSRASTPSLDLEFSTVSAMPSPWTAGTATVGASSNASSSNPTDDMEGLPDSPPVTAPPDYNQQQQQRLFVGGRARAVSNSISSGSSGIGGGSVVGERRPSLFDYSSNRPMTTTTGGHNRRDLTGGSTHIPSSISGNLLPPSVLRNRLGVPTSPASRSRAAASASAANHPPGVGGGGVVTFSPAPFRKTKEGYEQTTL